MSLLGPSILITIYLNIYFINSINIDQIKACACFVNYCHKFSTKKLNVFIKGKRILFECKCLMRNEF